jgi:stringent starvation protein B
MAETSTKPYFLRALHEWCTDSGYTPHIVVQVDVNTRVPQAFIKDGQITLNIGGEASNKLVIGNEVIEFQARFGGKVETISVPVSAVSAIYARETGAGMGFEIQAPDAAGPVQVPESEAKQQAEAKPEDAQKKPKRPHLKVVK